MTKIIMLGQKISVATTNKSRQIGNVIICDANKMNVSEDYIEVVCGVIGEPTFELKNFVEFKNLLIMRGNVLSIQKVD
jgi:hypothetical protein